MDEPGSRPAYRITDLEREDRPRERMRHSGPAALADAELIAILLRTGVPGENAVEVARRLLKHFGGLKGIYNAPPDELESERGIGAAKAAQIQAAIELGRRVTAARQDGKAISSPSDVADLVAYDLAPLPQEQLRVLLLDTKNHVIDQIDVYRGSVNMSQVRVAEVFKDAVARHAAAIIVVHNHPSGDPTPSPDDVALTRAITQAGKLLDVEVLDHLVIGQGSWVSLKERGLGFS